MNEITWKLIEEGANRCIDKEGLRSKKGFRMEFLGASKKCKKIGVFKQNKEKDNPYSRLYNNGEVDVCWIVGLEPEFVYIALGLRIENNWIFGMTEKFQPRIKEVSDQQKEHPNGLTVYYRDSKITGFSVRREDGHKRFFCVPDTDEIVF